MINSEKTSLKMLLGQQGRTVDLTFTKAPAPGMAHGAELGGCV